MSEQDETFRATIRFNRVEYSDLDKDLSRYSGANKGARIRLLMRLGLQVANGQITAVSHAGDHPHLAPVVGLPRGAKKSEPQQAAPSEAPTQPAPAASASPTVSDASAKPQSIETADALAGMGFDPTNFQFGATAR